jgi:hypothetical protein
MCKKCIEKIYVSFMSLLDEYNFDCSYNKSSLDINKDFDDIDNLIIDISRYNYNDKQLVIYNKYGFDNGFNLYILYAYILDFYVRFFIFFTS